ncbi:MAG TPA: oligosaccharide flippase family protein [Candidatus Woesebacteria bacterium]|nr:oligosaccharide flippase family protein [Candidatus Woesebacteria bacterium]
MEKIRKILQSQTIKDTLISFIGLGFTAAVGFFYTVVLARTLGPENFGVFSAITALVAIVYSLGDLGISSAIINFIPKLKEKRQNLINTGFWFEFAIGLVVLLLFGLFALLHTIIIPGSLSEQVLLAGFIAFNYLLINFAQAVFTAEHKFFTYSLSQIIDAGIKIILVFVLLSVSRLSISTAFIANIVSTIIALLITFCRELIKIQWSFDRPIFSKMFHFAKWIAVSKVFSVFTTRIDVILLNLIVGSFQAGIFSAASRITLFFSLLISSLGSVVNPRFSGFDTPEKIISYMRKLVLLIGAISVVMVLSALLAKPIINIVFGDKYLSAIPVFQALTLAMIPFMFTLITTPALTYSFGLPRFIARLTAVQVISIVVIDIIFIPSLGAFAPALALGLGNIIVLVVSIFKLNSLFKNNGKT